MVRATGTLSTRAVGHMEERLPWFSAMPADQRAWVGLVVQAGIRAFAEWLRRPDEERQITGEVFAAAPREMARAVTLQQTVDLIRVTVEVVEDAVPELAGSDEVWLREHVLRFSREVAFAAALVYAQAAEERGAWDARLEALVVDAVLRGDDDDALLSRAAALGWDSRSPVAAVAGGAREGEPEALLDDVHRTARHVPVEVLAGVQGGLLVILLGAPRDPLAAATALLPEFDPGPVVLGHTVPELAEAAASVRAALSGVRAAPGWPDAPRPVPATDLLPERALDGDPSACTRLVEDVYIPLLGTGDAIMDTVAAYVESAGSLEATARLLYVHPNTVRYRLRRAAEATGLDATQPRPAFVLRVALTVGRLDASGRTL